MHLYPEIFHNTLLDMEFNSYLLNAPVNLNF